MVLVGCGGPSGIHKAAAKGNIEAVKKHLAAGADVNAKDVDGETPLDLTIRWNQPETADLLRKHGGKTGEEFSIHEAAGKNRNGDIEAVRKHLASGTDVNAKDSLASTALRYAVGGGHKEIVELLIAKGADVNAKHKYGSTPLHWAAGDGHNEIVELLIANGADVNAKADNGRTPLDSAEAIRDSGEIADLLRKHGGKTAEELKTEGK